jgi:predicted dithiol-disulfide oxidoreductase (DUF899 family)
MSEDEKRVAQQAHERAGTREEWLAARESLLEREKELTRRSDELARERQALPWVRIEKEYHFATEQGTKTLAELFDGRSQLLVYHFMFGPDYEAGCPVCSSSADTVNGAVPHLNARDLTMLYVSRAPLEKLEAYKRRMGWTFPWASSYESDFNFDFEVSAPKEQVAQMLEGAPPIVEQLAADCGTDAPGYMTERQALSAFALEDGVVYQTYSTFARGVEIMMGFYPLLDRAPKGRHESGDSEFWIRRHDEYENGDDTAGNRSE